MEERFQLDESEIYNTYITDTKTQLRFCRLCENGMGLKTSVRELALEVCKFLNDNNKEIKP